MDNFFDSAPQLYGRGQVISEINFRFDEIEVSLFGHIPALRDLGRFIQYRSFQGHSRVNDPVVNRKGFVTHFLYS